MSSRRMLIATVGAALAAAPSAAVAAPSDDEAEADKREEAKEAFLEAHEKYRAGQYEEALELFERADSLHPDADMQFNIGLCHERLEHWQEAIDAFELYLRTKDDPPDRADVDARIRHARTLMRSRR